MLPLLRTVLFRIALTVAVGVASLAPARGASSDVDAILLAKVVTLLQIGADRSTDLLFEPTPFVFAVLVNATAPGSILGGSFSLAGQQPISLSQTEPATFLFAQRFDAPEDLGAAFPDGSYSVTLQTATPPTPFSGPIDFHLNLPSAYPRLTNSEWFSVVIQFDVRNEFTFFWNIDEFTPFSTDPAHPSFVQFQFADIFNNTQYTRLFQEPIPGLIFDPGTFTPGIYIGRVMYGNVDKTEIGTTSLAASSLLMTEFIISAVDGPPVLTSPTGITVNQGQLFIYTVEATNMPAELTDVSGLPSDNSIQFNPAGFIGGYPQTPGRYQLGISLSNIVGTTNATLTLDVQAAATLAITSSTRAAAGVGDPFRFQVLAPGGSSATRLTTSQLPPGLSADPVTGEITGAPTTAGDYTVQLHVTDGNATADGVLLISVNQDPAFPTIRSATSATIAPGQDFTYKINATPDRVSSNNGFGTNATDDTSYSLVGDLPLGLSFDAKTGTISGRFQGSPQHSGEKAKSRLSGGALVSNVQLFATNSRGTSTIPLVFFTKPVGAVNISTRLAIANGDNVLIAGFIVTGNSPKKLVLRAVGPSLPVAGALQDPVLEIHAADGHLLATNDSWRSDDEQAVIDSGVPPADAREAAIVAAFQPGNYTAIVHGKDGGTGVALVELYDLGTASIDASSDAKLANISTRGLVQTGDNVMIGGFIISQVQSRVIVRAIGPSLAAQGVSGALSDTVLELHDGNGQTIAVNDDWQTDPAQAQQIKDTTIPPTDPRESAIVATLNPGNYTAVVRGKNGTTGVALAEVYALQ
ncbi:MAG: putative Ig domain-containing protein [Chthoniobacterales bacterium]